MLKDPKAFQKERITPGFNYEKFCEIKNKKKCSSVPGL